MHAILVSSLIALAPAAPDALAPSAEVDADAAAQITKTRYEFDDDKVDGERLKPGGVHIRGKLARRHESMISVRGAFSDHLHRLALDI